MLSYQHAYHAGGPADLAKHLALATLLHGLTRKSRPISYFETHAGRGVYNLGGPEAQKTGEAAEGVEAWEAAIGALPEHPFCDALKTVREAYGARAYPGSPLLARALLRPGDRMALMELHPAEHAALRRTFAETPIPGPNPLIEKRDGGEGAMALLPPDHRKGLVLIDPSYEVKDEYRATGKLAMNILTKWPEASVAIWYPILPAGRHMELRQMVSALQPVLLEHRFDLKDGKGMTGTGLLVLNAPHGTEAALREACALGAPVLEEIEQPRRAPRRMRPPMNGGAGRSGPARAPRRLRPGESGFAKDAPAGGPAAAEGEVEFGRPMARPPRKGLPQGPSRGKPEGRSGPVPPRRTGPGTPGKPPKKR